MSSKKRGKSGKTAVISHLGEKYLQGKFPDGIVTGTEITRAMADLGSKLSRNNPANFLKDLLRHNPEGNWPEELLEKRIYGRQVYGQGRVLQFFEAPEGVDPFAEDADLPDEIPVEKISSLPMDSLARSLGRTEETWLTQVVVNLGLIGQHLAVHSPDAETIKDLRFLQVGMKTQPEIDAVFVAEYALPDAPEVENVFVTVELKQRRERVLPDQIREQVRKAFEETAKIRDREICAVKPMAVNVIRKEFEGVEEDLILVREYGPVRRNDFDEKYARLIGEEAVYELPLFVVACSAYAVRPAIGALGARRAGGKRG